MTTNTTALDVIRELSAAGNNSRYIARALTLRGIPTAKGLTHWQDGTVRNLARRHGLDVRFRPAARGAAQVPASSTAAVAGAGAAAGGQG